MDAYLKNDADCSPVPNVTDGREAYSKFWIAIYSRPNSERKLAKELTKLGIESYVPIQTQTRQWSDRKKKVDVVIIPMIVFAHVSELDLTIIRTLQHAVRILSNPGSRKPAQIPDKQIYLLRLMLEKAEENVEFVGHNFKAADHIKIINGNLKGLEGLVEHVSSGKISIIISIDLLGGAKVTINSTDIVLA